jgi:hypothetical protein
MSRVLASIRHIWESLSRIEKLIKSLSFWLVILGSAILAFFSVPEAQNWRERAMSAVFIERYATVILCLFVVVIIWLFAVGWERSHLGPLLEVSPIEALLENREWLKGSTTFEISLKNKGSVPISETQVLVRAKSGTARTAECDHSHQVRWKSRRQDTYRGQISALDEQKAGILIVYRRPENGNPCLAIWIAEQKEIPLSIDAPLNDQKPIEFKLIINCATEEKIRAKPQEFLFTASPDPQSECLYKIEGWRRTA